MKPILFTRLLQSKIVERYLTGPEFDDMDPLEDREGEPFIIGGKVEEEKMMDDEPGPSNQSFQKIPDTRQTMIIATQSRIRI